MNKNPEKYCDTCANFSFLRVNRDGDDEGFCGVCRQTVVSLEGDDCTGWEQKKGVKQ